MKEVFLQVWEESNKKEGVKGDGCSIHLNSEYRKSYIDSIYNDRNEYDVPISYERFIGEPILVKVSKPLYEEILKHKSLRLQSYEMNNLLNMNEIVFYD